MPSELLTPVGSRKEQTCHTQCVVTPQTLFISCLLGKRPVNGALGRCSESIDPSAFFCRILETLPVKIGESQLKHKEETVCSVHCI